MTAIGLQAVDGQDDLTLLAEKRFQSLRVSGDESLGFVIPVQEVGHRAFSEIDTAAREVLVDLGDGAVLNMPEPANQGNDVKAELMVRQSEMGFGLRSERNMESRALVIGATPDHQVESCDGVERCDGPVVVIIGPESVPALGAMGSHRGQDAAKDFAMGITSVEQLEAITERGRSLLLSDGYAGLVEWAGELSVTHAAGNGALLGGMPNYFAGHQERLNYVLRLRRGQSIGSGMVEGAAKNMIGRRLKANSARWPEGNANRMAGLVCAMYGVSATAIGVARYRFLQEIVLTPVDRHLHTDTSFLCYNLC